MFNILSFKDGVQNKSYIHTYVFPLFFVCICLVNRNPADAIEISMTSVPAMGSTLDASSNDQLIVNIILDTEDFVGLTLLSVGVIFEPSQLSYNQAQSRTMDFLLYNEGIRPNAYLYPASTCDDSEGMGCALRVGHPNQVNVDFICSDLVRGTSSATGTSEGSEDEVIPGGLLATLVFDIAPTARSSSTRISLSITSPGNIVGTSEGGTVTATLAESSTFTIITEDLEPDISLLDAAVDTDILTSDMSEDAVINTVDSEMQSTNDLLIDDLEEMSVVNDASVEGDEEASRTSKNHPKSGCSIPTATKDYPHLFWLFGFLVLVTSRYRSVTQPKNLNLKGASLGKCC